MTQSARAKLLALFGQKRADGMRDLKFLFGNVSESTVEDVCAEVNRLYDQVEKGNAKLVDKWGDSNRPAKAA